MYLAYPAQGINPANLPFDLQLAATAKSLQSCPTLCDPRDGSPWGSPVPEVLQARTLEQVAISFSNAWKWKVKGKSLSRVWLSDPMDCSPPGSSVHGIFQARVLEWGAIVFSDIGSVGLTKHTLVISSHVESELGIWGWIVPLQMWHGACTGLVSGGFFAFWKVLCSPKLFIMKLL